ncbi:DUF3247 family protein [Luteibacter sp. PPL201]|uniref:DUF3247 family protein n=1 Tax=Luteibacter sahnii TaxID=3021977 RepID=A0ABT6B8F1_9GAMM|nr:DUF3247 family protein [Luteibacter sp. PPL193]MDY1547721.1 DUF3247 family protein [Luteibacter sp. PPL193]
MGRTARIVFTRPDDIARIERWVNELAINAHVRIHLVDGHVVEGIVMVTPTVQVFHGQDGDQGINGTVKLEAPVQPGWSGIVWLGDIARVEHLDSVTMGATKA